MSCFFGSAVYFTQYNAGDAGKYAIISNCLSMAQIVTLFITPFAMKISWIPVITMIIIIVCMFFFDLDKKYERAVAELEQGKHRKNKLQV